MEKLMVARFELVIAPFHVIIRWDVQVEPEPELRKTLQICTPLSKTVSNLQEQSHREKCI